MNDKKTGAGTALGAGVLGAAIGAAAGVAATKIMSDPEMKTKAVDAFKKAKKYAMDGVSQVKNKAQEWQDTAQDKVQEKATEVGKVVRTSSKSAKVL